MQPQAVHFIGIGGAGLSAIATVLLEQGYTVSGSDLRSSPTTERLTGLGANVHMGHAATNLGKVDVVVVSSAVPEGNPEIEEARRQGIPVVKRAEWLGHMMAGKRGVAVAGTHGKTTTTAMLALILRDAGVDPTFVVGGDIPQLGTNAGAGKGDIFVIEADEYDRTFLGLRPEVAVVTFVEWDHPDCYPTPESMHRAFLQFLNKLPSGGLLVACADEPGVRDLIGDWQAHRLKDGTVGVGPNSALSNVPVLVTYGLNAGNDWRAVDLQPNTRGGYDFAVQSLTCAGRTGNPRVELSTSVPGSHNVKNSLAALVVADHLGVPLDQAAITLALFTGVGRRFEIKGEAEGILVVDDYAHHPTEIQATLAGARARYPGRSIWAMFQPHTYSRTSALLEGFAQAFNDADHVLLTDIFSARELDDGSIHSRDILTRMTHPDAYYIGGLADAAEFLIQRLRPNDVLITLGAGDGYQVGEMVLKQTRKTFPGRRGPHLPGYYPLARSLEARFGQRLRRDELLAAHTTLRVGGPADLWLTVTSLNELIEAVTLAWQHEVPAQILGSGANMLISDRGVRGLVLHNRCQQMSLLGEAAGDEEDATQRAHLESGVILPSLAHRLADLGLSGLEWAVGVPGTIGGAVVNNAGAYGSAMADSLLRAELYSRRTGKREWHSVDWFAYEYRSSRLKRLSSESDASEQEGFVVLQAELVLQRKAPAQVQELMATYSARRRATQPPGASIGSMFKNPPGDYAGRLIEAAGLKGRQLGEAQVSTVHANFFVNRGGAKAADFAALIDLARQTVKERFEIDLELEIQKVGDWGDE